MWFSELRAASCEARRPTVRHSQHADRQPGSPAGDSAYSTRAASSSLDRRSARGSSMVWEARPTTCPALSRSTRHGRLAGRRTTAVRFCPPPTRRRGSAGKVNQLKDAGLRNINRSDVPDGTAAGAACDDSGAQRRAPRSRATTQHVEGVVDALGLSSRMQASLPRVMDLPQESKATLDAYGIGQDDDRRFRPAVPVGTAVH